MKILSCVHNNKTATLIKLHLLVPETVRKPHRPEQYIVLVKVSPSFKNTDSLNVQYVQFCNRNEYLTICEIFAKCSEHRIILLGPIEEDSYAIRTLITLFLLQAQIEVLF